MYPLATSSRVISRRAGCFSMVTIVRPTTSTETVIVVESLPAERIAGSNGSTKSNAKAVLLTDTTTSVGGRKLASGAETNRKRQLGRARVQPCKKKHLTSELVL